MIDVNNIHVNVEVPSTAEPVNRDRPREGSSTGSVSSSSDVHPPESPKASKTDEKTSWQLSPEAQKAIEAMSTSTSTASVRFDTESNRVIIEVRNARTGELIREIPPEELLHQLVNNGVHPGLALDTTI